MNFRFGFGLKPIETNVQVPLSEWETAAQDPPFNPVASTTETSWRLWTLGWNSTQLHEVAVIFVHLRYQLRILAVSQPLFLRTAGPLVHTAKTLKGTGKRHAKL
jgi:hypothetical protein